MAERPSPRHSPRQHRTSDDACAPEQATGHFAPHASPVWAQIQDLNRYLQKKLIKKDEKHGVIYVAKQTGTDFCKVGYAGGNAKQRLNAINKCAIDRESSYSTPPVLCAWRGEHIIHKLLYHCQHVRTRCKCQKQNREWFQNNYRDTIRLVQTVYSWLRREPYDTEKQQLKPEWEVALCRWMGTQQSESPLDWNDFFLIGPGTPDLDGLCYTKLPIYAPNRQLSLTSHTLENLAKLLKNVVMQKRTRRFEALSDSQEAFESPVSTTLEVCLPTRHQQPDLRPSEHWIAAVDDQEIIASRHLQSVAGNEDEIDVENITAHMPGAFPGYRNVRPSFTILDEYELPGSSAVLAELVGLYNASEHESLNDAYHPGAGISQPDGSHLKNLVSDVLSITDRLLLQEATTVLEQTSAVLVVPSTASSINAPEEITANLSIRPQVTLVQNPVRYTISKTIDKPCVKSTPEPAEHVQDIDEDSSGEKAPTELGGDDRSLAIDREISRELRSLREDFQEYRGLEGSASDLAAVETNQTHTFDSASSSQRARKILMPKSLILKQWGVSRVVEIGAHGDDGEGSCSDAVASSSEDPDQDFADDEESCGDTVVSPSEDPDRDSTDDEDFPGEEVSPSSESEYSLSTSASDFTEPEEYEIADGLWMFKDSRNFSTSKFTSEVAEIRRLGAAYRCR
jgi:T5orf172 domain